MKDIDWKQIFLSGLIGIFVFIALIASTKIVKAESDSYEETISSGQRTYTRFCSVCHGNDAMGAGTFAKNLTKRPPDLTKLSANNENIFPWKRVYESIDGKNRQLAHGTPEMPIWGQTFDLSHWGDHQLEYADVIVRGRVFELILYLESIQQE